MQTLTHDQFVEIMLGRRGAFFATIDTITEPKMRKTDNPYLGVMKHSRVNGQLNWIYENAVNNQRYREAQPIDENGEIEHFTPEARRWGVRIQREDNTYTPLVVHEKKGETFFYLEMKVLRSIASKYMLDGKEIDKELIRPFLYEASEGRQEVENPVILRDYSVSSIQSVTMDGSLYLLKSA